MRREERRPRVDRRGFALATTLLVLIVLTVIAIGASWLATSEKRTSFAEGVHVSAVFSADAGGEAAINYLRLLDSPPQITDFSEMLVQAETDVPIHGEQNYSFDCTFRQKKPRPGWGIEYLDYDYDVVSNGVAASSGQSGVQLIASRLFREGY